MRTFVVIAILLFVPCQVLGCNTGEAASNGDEAQASAAESVDDSTAETGETASVQLDLDGMTCVNCAKSIEEAFDDHDGVVDGTVDFGDRRADVDYDPEQLDEAGVAAIVEEAGFDAEIIADGDE